MESGLKIPESVLVVIHTCAGLVLLLERADHPGYWQSVTGSLDAPDEPLRQTCQREVFEETGILAQPADFIDLQIMNHYEIYPQWRQRYPQGTTHNREHVFALCLPSTPEIVIAPAEHLGHQWLDFQAAAETCFSWTNVAAIRHCARLASAGGH